jgi:hypothetical protein
LNRRTKGPDERRAIKALLKTVTETRIVKTGSKDELQTMAEAEELP